MKKARITRWVSEKESVASVLGRDTPLTFNLEATSHKLSIHLHHALYDADTLAILPALIARAYKGEELPKQVPLRESVLASLPAEGTEDAWKQVLQPAFGKIETPPFPSLAAEKPNSEDRAFASARRALSVTQGDLITFAQATDSSPRAILLAAWAQLLRSYLESSHFLIGETISVRGTHPSLSDALGCFISTTPIPIAIDADSTASSLAQSIHAAQQCSLSHPHLPPALLRKLLSLPSNAPLYSSVFTYSPEADSVSTPVAPLDRATTHDIAVEHAIGCEVFATSQSERPEVEITFDPALLDHAASQELLFQLDHLIASMVRNKNLSLAPSVWSDIAESHRSVAQTDARWIDALPQLLPAIVSELTSSGDRVAVETWQSDAGNLRPAPTTYAELKQQIGKIASALQAETTPGAAIAVELTRSSNTYAVLLAILLSGRVYVPIDQYLPEDRCRVLIEESKASLIIKDDFEARLHLKDRQAADIAALSLPSSDQLACIMFTSGSTGKPKQVGLTHGNLDAALRSFRHIIGQCAPVDKASRFMARSAEAFDVHLLEGLLPLSVGAAIVTAPRDLYLDDLPGKLKLFAVTHTAVVPSLFHHPDGSAVVPSDLPYLRLLIVGGEKIRQKTIDDWCSSSVPVLQAYGPTEATIGISCKVMQPKTKASNVGPVFPGSQYTVVDTEANSTLPLYQVGELVIGGPQVAGKGYLGLDSDAFFENSYKTGDLARMLPGGEVEIIGRKDSSQVKVNGARLELDEISALLESVDADARIHTSCIVAQDEQSQRQSIVAFIATQTKRTNEAPSADVPSSLGRKLLDSARKRLPPWMWPSRIVELDFLPLQSVSGKVNAPQLRSVLEALPVRDGSPSGDADAPAPEDELAGTLQACVQQVLRTEVSFDQDLYSAGLDSLASIRLAGHLRKKGYQIQSQDILSNPTLRAMHDWLSQGAKGTGNNDKTTLAIPTLSDLGVSSGAFALVAPTLPVQTAMLAKSSLDEGKTYVAVLSRRLPSGTSPDKIKQMLQSLAQRHSIYRTCFATHGQDWWQLVLSAPSDGYWKWDSDAKLVADMDQVPPLRFQLRDDELRLKIHHALYDGVSLSLLWKHIDDALAQKLDERTSSFAKLATSVVKELPQNPDAFWSKELADVSPTKFPSVTGRRVKDATIETVSHSCSAGFQAIKQRAGTLRCTPQTLMLAAMSMLVSQYTASSESTLGLVLNGRHWALDGIEQAHGPFVNVLPARVSREEAASPNKLQSHLARLLKYQCVSLGAVKRAAKLEDVPFDTLLAFMETDAADADDLPAIDMDHEFPVAVEATGNTSTDGFSLLLRFSTSRLDQRSAHLFLQQLEGLIFSSGPLPADKQSILNPHPVEPSVEDHFVRRFLSHVKAYPDATAFSWKEASGGITRTTYGELDARSDSVSSVLASYQQRDVAVLLDRGPQWYTLMLGIWKAGKGYVPIDSSLPPERMTSMLETVGDVVLVTDRASQVKASCKMVEPQSLFQGSSSTEIPTPSLNDTAYIMFTSGSTGTPKGVRLSHRALAGAVLSWEKMLPHSRSSNMLQLASPGFDVSLIEVCMPLGLGFSFASGPKEWLLEDLPTAIEQLGITIADMPAALATTIPAGLSKQLGKLSLVWR